MQALRSTYARQGEPSAEKELRQVLRRYATAYRYDLILSPHEARDLGLDAKAITANVARLANSPSSLRRFAREATRREAHAAAADATPEPVSPALLAKLQGLGEPFAVTLEACWRGPNLHLRCKAPGADPRTVARFRYAIRCANQTIRLGRYERLRPWNDYGIRTVQATEDDPTHMRFELQLIDFSE